MTVSDSLRAKIVQQMFNGYTIAESHSSVRRFVSYQTVRNCRKKFLAEEEQKERELGEENGLLAAARELNVTPLVASLIAIGETARKAKVEIHDLPGAVPVAKALNDFNMDKKDFPRLLREVFQKSKDKGLTVEATVNRCAEINSLEEKYGKNYEELLKEFTEMAFQLPLRQKELESLQQLVVETSKKRDQALVDCNTTLERVDRFLKANDFLVSIGISPDDAEGAKNVLSNLKALRFDVKRVVSALKKVDVLDSKLSRQRNELSKGEDLLRELKEKLDSIKGEIEEKTELLDAAHSVERTGLSPEQLGKLRVQVLKISTARGVDPPAALAKFMDEVEKSYDLLLGFSEALKAAAKAKEATDLELERTRALVEELKKSAGQYTKNAREVKNYSDLRALGVGDSTILLIHSILGELNLAPGAVESEFRKLGDLSRLEKEVKERTQKAEDNLKKLVEKGEEFRKRHGKEWSLVVQLDKMLQKGVRPGDLERWGRAILDAGLDRTRIEEELLELKDLSRTKREVEEELSKLRITRETLAGQIGVLQAELGKLEKQRRDLAESMKTITSAAKKSLEVIVGDAIENMSASRAKAAKDLEVVWKGRLTTYQEARKELESEIKRLQEEKGFIDKAVKAGRGLVAEINDEIGTFKPLAELAKAIADPSLADEKYLLTVNDALLDRTETNLHDKFENQHHEYYPLKQAIRTLRREIRGRIDRGP